MIMSSKFGSRAIGATGAAIACLALCGVRSDSAVAPESVETPEWRLPRPRLAGTLRPTLRERGRVGGAIAVDERTEEWKVSETAIIVCDMWDDIYCRNAARRIGVLAPRMNAVLSAARDLGVMIVHAPSDTMTMYEDTPHRKRMKSAKRVEPASPIEAWCDRDPEREPAPPLETSKSPCDDPITGAIVRRYSRQHPALDISGFDGVSDDGREIHSHFVAEGIRNVVIMGVHTNMCVLGRSFGIRRMTRLGYNVALARDLTDAMYDPREPPRVSHARGTELVVEHIETYLCPSLEGIDLTRCAPGSAGP